MHVAFGVFAGVFLQVRRRIVLLRAGFLLMRSVYSVCLLGFAMSIYTTVLFEKRVILIDWRFLIIHPSTQPTV